MTCQIVICPCPLQHEQHKNAPSHGKKNSHAFLLVDWLSMPLKWPSNTKNWASKKKNEILILSHLVGARHYLTLYRNRPFCPSGQPTGPHLLSQKPNHLIPN